MDYKKLKAAAETITLSGEQKRRMAKACNAQISECEKEISMKANKNNTFLRKPATVFAALAVCLTLSVTAVAASGTLKGSFRDIKGWQGAIVGTAYDQATDEIGMSITVNGDELTVLAAFADPQMAPYVYAERLGIAAYHIVDANGKVVKEGTAGSAEVVNGQAAVTVRLDDLDSGSYKLVVTAFVSEKKADQPMNLNGRWECTFTK